LPDLEARIRLLEIFLRAKPLNLSPKFPASWRKNLIVCPAETSRTGSRAPNRNLRTHHAGCDRTEHNCDAESPVPRPLLRCYCQTGHRLRRNNVKGCQCRSR
jgi:hypothetical protein